MMRNRTVMGVVVTALMMYSLYAFFGQRAELRETAERAEALGVLAQELEAEREALTARLEKSDDPEYLAELARERLRMTEPGELVFFFVP